MMKRAYVLILIHPMLVKSFSFIPKITSTTPRRKYSFRRSSLTMMPEGPEVRTLVDQLQPAVGKRLVNFRILSGRYTKVNPRGYDDFWDTMSPDNGSSTTSMDMVTSLSCKGKFMYIILDHGKLDQDGIEDLRGVGR